jgi:hypothetical protein
MSGVNDGMSGGYGFVCAYCDARFDPPTDDRVEATKAAQTAGWRSTFGPSRLWGTGWNNSCPSCAEGDHDAVALCAA